jgi:hypothetical protein
VIEQEKEQIGLLNTDKMKTKSVRKAEEWGNMMVKQTED